MFIRAKPDSLSVVMVVCKNRWISFKVLSAEVTGKVQAIRSKQLMLGKMSGSQIYIQDSSQNKSKLSNSPLLLFACTARCNFRERKGVAWHCFCGRDKMSLLV